MNAGAYVSNRNSLGYAPNEDQAEVANVLFRQGFLQEAAGNPNRYLLSQTGLASMTHVSVVRVPRPLFQ
eukprot:1836535-Lingulodinium_polyedra.AAC.1